MVVIDDLWYYMYNMSQLVKLQMKDAVIFFSYFFVICTWMLSKLILMLVRHGQFDILGGLVFFEKNPCSDFD